MQPHPLGVMSDPRVCRGSIVAKRREEAARQQAEEQRRRDEQRYRTELMRNRLSMIISGTMGGGQSRSPILPLRQKQPHQRFDGGTRSHHHELAKLAGPLRRRLGVAQLPAQKQQLQKMEAKIRPKAQLDANRTPFLRLPLINSNATKQKSPVGGSLDDFGEVQFLPFRSTAAGATTSPAKVIPIMNTRSGEGSGGFVPFPPMAASASPLPRLVMHQSTATTKRLAKMGGAGKRPITWSNVPSPLDPPPSAAGAPVFADIAIQTEEERAFEDTFAPLICEMVAGAISEAQRSLMEEEEMRRVEEYNQKLMETIQQQHEKNQELNRVVEQQIKTQKELNEQKLLAIRQLEALNSRRAATDTVDDLIGKSLNELLNRHMIHEDKSQRSVAADTRHLERTLQRSDKAVKQVRSDFFPYVYSRAEKIFVEQLAGSYLKDALFAQNDERRNDAHLLLNTQIHKYNVMRGKKPEAQQRAVTAKLEPLKVVSRFLNDKN